MPKKFDYGSLYTLRKDGRYVASYVDERGRHYIYDRDPKALHQKMQQIEELAAAPATFRMIAELWHDEAYEIMPSGTWASYAAHYKRALERFGDTPALDITAHDINTHLEAMKAQKFAASTVNKQRVIYRSIFQRAIIDAHYGKTIKINPALSVKLPKGLPKPKKREAPEEDVVKRIEDCCTTAYFGDFPMFLMCTGLRRGEALAVRWCDIDFEAGLISIYSSVSLRGARGVTSTPKTESGVRQVPILPPVLQVLRRPDDAQDTDYVFHGEDPSRPMPHSAYTRKWNHYCRDMGFVIDQPEERTNAQGKKYVVHKYKNTLTAHYLRHGYATLLYEAGIDEKEGAKLMGHADEEMLRKVYAHLRVKKEATAVDKLKAFTKNGLASL